MRLASLAHVVLLGLAWIAAPSLARAGDFELGLAADGGAVWSYASNRYTLFGEPAGDLDAFDVWGPSGGLELTLTHAVDGVLHLGGVVRGAVMGAPPNPFSATTDVVGTIDLGPALALIPDGPGPYGIVWAGLGLVLPVRVGFAVGFRVGYRWLVSDDVALGLGASVTTRWSFSSEEGDHGSYEYVYGSVIPALELRTAFSL